jgi:exosortase
MSPEQAALPSSGKELKDVPPRAITRPEIAALAGLVVILLIGVYWGILRDLIRQWWDDANYSHGFVVAPFSAFLIWHGRHRLRGIVPRGSAWGLVLLLAGLGTLLVGDLIAENFLSRTSLIVLLAGIVLFILGPEILRGIRFPLCFLLFMVPVPAILLYAVTFPLQQFAAEQAAQVLDALGVPVLLDGNIIHLSQISLGVTEACSGIRSLISLAAGAMAWAYLLLPNGWPRIIFVAATVPITIFANVGRVVATGLIGQWFGVEYASGFFHEFAGWVVYLLAFLCLSGLHVLIQLVARPRRLRSA